MNASPKTWTILGAAGPSGSALVERLLLGTATDGDRLVLVDPDGEALGSLVASLGSQASRVRAEVSEAGSEVAAAAFAESFAVVDASAAHGEQRLALARAALAGGAHWVDLCDRRATPEEVSELDGAATAAERVALTSAGLHCALTAAFARTMVDGLVRTNEILIGVIRDPAKAGATALTGWLERFGERPKLLIGGEWSQRAPFGDRRRFPHPGAHADLFAENFDVPEHDLFTERPYRATSVRVSLSIPGRLERSALHRAGKRVATGKADAGREARKLARFSKLIGRGNRPSVVTLIVRGIDPDRLPRERRLSLLAPTGLAALDAIPAGLCLNRLARGEFAEPGVQPVVQALEAAELESELSAAGVTVTRGDLSGWRAPGA